MSKYLLFSPHLDDAVLSSGASISKWTRSGNEVTVVSVFTSCGQRSLPSSISYYNRRKENDIKALEFLGCKYDHLNFLDAPFRDQKYNSFSTILFHHDFIQDEVLTSLKHAIESIISKLNPDYIIFPLGVGGHIDHHLLFACSLRLGHLAKKTLYYEDLPYSLVPCWTAIRLKVLKASIKNLNVFFNSESMPTHLLETPLPFLENYLVNKKDIEESNDKYLQEIEFLKFSDSIKEISLLNGNEWLLNEISHNEDDFKKKCKAIGFYETEWPILFGKLKMDIQNHLLRNQASMYFERFLILK